MTGTSAAVSPILSVARDDAAADRIIEEHTHPEGMLVWSGTATIIVDAASREWLVPPNYGLWIPAGHVHAERALRAGSVHVVRFARSFTEKLWREPTGVAISPLVRELVNHLQVAAPDDPSRLRVEPLLFELLAPLPAQSVDIALPVDARLRTIAKRILADPADDRDLDYWADQVHSGSRTISRLFVSETGMTFGRWRKHVRMRAAIRYLAEGLTVSQIARATGYRRTSAFIVAFRRETGQTPGSYSSTTNTSDKP